MIQHADSADLRAGSSGDDELEEFQVHMEADNMLGTFAADTWQGGFNFRDVVEFVLAYLVFNSRSLLLMLRVKRSVNFIALAHSCCSFWDVGPCSSSFGVRRCM